MQLFISTGFIYRPQAELFMSKSRKEILLELLELESQNVGGVGNLEESTPKDAVNSAPVLENSITEDAVNEPITKPKRKLTEKQLEALKKGQQKRDENARLRKDEAEKKLAEEKLILEKKIVKKAISIKKKELKRQAALDEVSDDDTPVEKIKEVVAKAEAKIPVQPVKTGPSIRFF